MSGQTPQTVQTPLGEFAVLPRRVVFDEHDEHHPATGQLLRTFGRQDLEEIARACNERDARGAWCPLTLGHMVRDQYDASGALTYRAREEEQPDTVGYARNFQVSLDPTSGKHVITADYYLRPDRYQEALTYPRTSVELWPQRIFDPIALLRRTPRLDIPQWTYARSCYPGQPGTILRYQREDYSMPAPPGPTNGMPSPGGSPPGMGGAPPPGAPPGGMGQKLEEYMRHCASHKYAREIYEHFGKPEIPGAGAGAGGPPPAPGAAPPGQLGAEPPMQEPAAFSKDAEIAALQKQLAALHRENRIASRRQDLQTLAEVVELDVEEELGLLGDLQPELYQRELSRIRNRYAPRLDSREMVPILGEELDEEGEPVEHPVPYSRRPGASRNRFVENGSLTHEGSRDIQRFASQYRRDHPEATFEEVREVYIREHSNGHARNGRN